MCQCIANNYKLEDLWEKLAEVLTDDGNGFVVGRSEPVERRSVSRASEHADADTPRVVNLNDDDSESDRGRSQGGRGKGKERARPIQTRKTSHAQGTRSNPPRIPKPSADIPIGDPLSLSGQVYWDPGCPHCILKQELCFKKTDITCWSCYKRKTKCNRPDNARETPLNVNITPTSVLSHPKSAVPSSKPVKKSLITSGPPSRAVSEAVSSESTGSKRSIAYVDILVDRRHKRRKTAVSTNQTSDRGQDTGCKCYPDVRRFDTHIHSVLAMNSPSSTMLPPIPTTPSIDSQLVDFIKRIEAEHKSFQDTVQQILGEMNQRLNDFSKTWDSQYSLIASQLLAISSQSAQTASSGISRPEKPLEDLEPTSEGVPTQKSREDTPMDEDNDSLPAPPDSSENSSTAAPVASESQTKTDTDKGYGSGTERRSVEGDESDEARRSDGDNGSGSEDEKGSSGDKQSDGEKGSDEDRRSGSSEEEEVAEHHGSNEGDMEM